MTTMNGTPEGILVATSIPPRLVRDDAGEPVGGSYQSLCIQSWLECGFRIVSVNHPSEIAELAPRFPAVEFVATERNAFAITGRKNPFIADLLAALSRGPENLVGIANSDIVFEPTPAWGQLRSLVTSGAVVTGQRWDTRSLRQGTFARYIVGFDYFFFGRDAAGALVDEAQAFAMGLPWWDYWLPLSLAFRGQRMLHLERPVAIHLAHEASDAYGAHSAAWRGLALDFVRALAAGPPRKSSRSPVDLESIHAVGAELNRHSLDAAIDEGELDRRLIDLAGMAVRAIWAENLRLQDQKVESQSAAGKLFRDFADRALAGAALTLRNAKEREDKGELGEADMLYQTAFTNAPDDPGVLYACANFLGRTGRVDHAAELLRKAVARAPNTAILWSSLGSALIELNRADEGLQNLRKAVEIDPRSGPAYYELARALAYLRRPAEEIRRVQQDLRAVQGFPDAEQWAEHIGRDFMTARES
jgi:tetratricopeptide (TPR) repeat protein